jgi:hypothetical protein
MVAEVVTQAFGSEGVGQDTLISAIVQRLGSVTNGEAWKSAYCNDTQARAKKTWRQLSSQLKRYERRGRIPETLESDPKISTGKKHRSRSANVTDTELIDITLPKPTEAQPILPDLAVMKSLNGSEKLFTLEHVDDLEALLEHDIITKFLRKYTGNTELQGTLHTYLNALMHHPTNPFVTKTLEQQFRLNATDFSPEKVHRLRRFRATSNIAPASDPLNRRIRILYGLATTARGKNALLLNTVAIREQDTY